METSVRDAPEVLDGREVEFEAIESQLGALWKSLAEKAHSEGGPPVTRVVTLNLLVVAGTEADAAAAMDLAGRLSERHPSRILLVQAAPGPEGVSASLAVLCHRAGGGRQLCSEQVRLVTRGKASLRVAQHVAPLLVADVPVILWLPNHPLLLPIDEDLLALADRVVVDARAFPDTTAALERLATWIEKRREVVDLAWLRLERWRALTAQCFEGAESRHDLETLESIEVRYRTGREGTPEGRVEALYYGAWLASRLGCRWDARPVAGSAGERFVARRADKGEMHFSLVAAPRAEGAHGDLAGVTLVADGGRSRYRIARLGERDMAEVVVEAERACPAPVRVGFPTRDPLDLLSEALSGVARDALYAHALVAARGLSERP